MIHCFIRRICIDRFSLDLESVVLCIPVPQRDLPSFRRNGVTMSSDFLIEVEVRRRSAGNQPGSTIESQILNCPLNEYQDTALKLDQVHQMYEGPDQPRKES